MKQYKAEATYIGEKSRSKGKPEPTKTYQITIDEHPTEKENTVYPTLRRPDFTPKIEQYFNSWFELEQNWDILKIEEI